MSEDEQKSADALAGIKHIQEWLHSGWRANDEVLQTAQWGSNVCEFLTDFLDQLYYVANPQNKPQSLPDQPTD